MTAAAASPILLDSLLGRREERLVASFVLAFTGSLLIAVSAKVQIPFYPVPMTMQTFMILTIGMAFGWRLGAATVMLYLIQGALGFPVFAGTPEKGVGVAYMAGPTGGYLAGYLLAAASVGWLAERGLSRHALGVVLAMLIGNALIYLPGVLWLGALFGWDKPVLEWGFWPFLAGDGAKLLLAAAALPFAWKLIGKPEDPERPGQVIRKESV